jgi:hypothetical protein
MGCRVRTTRFQHLNPREIHAQPLGVGYKFGDAPPPLEVGDQRLDLVRFSVTRQVFIHHTQAATQIAYIAFAKVGGEYLA